ncbi:hypothetical protein [Bradyrhizobium sp. Leo170]|uniref:hypothetical protein n=1 Tax=Bradyrhizobium sp. Leo170 TaxID=1571199 RepID=UPI00102E3B73|nr:hypothetical protein [Bradyrhizobium sp. Leo170]TAI60180.1 hypothetical protein CWO89_42145 [Bradyrhizobium sp. Leo170]
MTKILAERAAEKRDAGEVLIREADALAAESSNRRMWAYGGPIDRPGDQREVQLARDQVLALQGTA